MATTAAREAILDQTADTLLTARRTHTPIEALPAELQPASEEEAFYVQDVMAAAFAPLGGWKIAAANEPNSKPFFAPMVGPWMADNGALFVGADRRLRGIEAEIAFQFTVDMPPRAQPYTREEVAAAVTCHPAIELLESAYVDPTTQARPNMLADLQMHGGFVAGPAVPQWQEIDWALEKVTLLTDSAIRKEGTGSAPAGPDLVRLLVYIVNEGAMRTGGLKRGAWVTTGSWTGLTFAYAGAEAVAHFTHAGRVSMQFGPDALKS